MHMQAGNPEGTPEYAERANKFGFPYRTLLGEILYAYVTCRPDISYSTVATSAFATCPDDLRYHLLNTIQLND